MHFLIFVSSIDYRMFFAQTYALEYILAGENELDHVVLQADASLTYTTFQRSTRLIHVRYVVCQAPLFSLGGMTFGYRNHAQHPCGAHLFTRAQAGEEAILILPSLWDGYHWTITRF